MKQITGSTGFDAKADKFYYRFQYTNERQQRRQVRRLFESESRAKIELRKAINKHEQAGERIHFGERMRFDELARRYEDSKVFAAQYVSDRKVAGLRSHQSVKIFLTVLEDHFGAKLIKSIRPSDIEKFKAARLATPTKDDNQRAISSVNRELAILRACLNFGVREGWLKENVFSKCSVISKADENKRERILSFEEEMRLQKALEYRNKQNKQTIIHIRPIVIAALDTGMRRGELFKLQWNEVDFDNGFILIKATNTKTQSSRVVGITERLHNELWSLWSKSIKSLNLRVFGFESECSTIKKAWRTLCEEAKLDDLNFNYLRHTFVTRTILSGSNAEEVMKASGHQTSATFMRYLNPTNDSAQRIAKQLHSFNTQSQES